MHLLPDFFDKVAEDCGLDLCLEFTEHPQVTGHRLGTANIGFVNLPARFGALKPEFLEIPLGTEPERQRSDLDSPGIDIDAMQVVPENKCGNCFVKDIRVRVFLLQRPAQIGIVVGFFIDNPEKIITVEKEVAAPDSRIQDPDPRGVFLCPE